MLAGCLFGFGYVFGAIVAIGVVVLLLAAIVYGRSFGRN
jgi:hypothetical protein